MQEQNVWCYVLLLHQTTTAGAIKYYPPGWCYVLLLHQTTTNKTLLFSHWLWCYVLLLHQTTTCRANLSAATLWCYVLLLHQTTTGASAPVHIEKWCYVLLLHQTTTGEKNNLVLPKWCYVLLLHQTTTKSLKKHLDSCGVMSFFYIKPQLTDKNSCYALVVLCPSSTSNHNVVWFTNTFFMWCYVLLLHQTTTSILCALQHISGVMSFFYIKPQQQEYYLQAQRSGVMSFFYIKPQHVLTDSRRQSVVLCPSSTSNHNAKDFQIFPIAVVLCPSSTSNHNLYEIIHWDGSLWRALLCIGNGVDV